MLAWFFQLKEWNMSCELQTNVLLALCIGFVAVWHLLCLQAWMGFRYSCAVPNTEPQSLMSDPLEINT